MRGHNLRNHGVTYMAEQKLRVIVIAGPIGAGKSTMAPRLPAHVLGVWDFVNADETVLPARGI